MRYLLATGLVAALTLAVAGAAFADDVGDVQAVERDAFGTPPDAFSDTGGWRKVERPASPGWTADEQAEVEKLRQREHELAVFVSTHRFWAEVTTGERVDARTRLKHAREA